MVFSHIPEAAWTVEQFTSSRLALFGWGVRKSGLSNPCCLLLFRKFLGLADVEKPQVSDLDGSLALLGTTVCRDPEWIGSGPQCRASPRQSLPS
jgi:hypothetical protein